MEPGCQTSLQVLGGLKEQEYGLKPNSKYPSIIALKAANFRQCAERTAGQGTGKSQTKRDGNGKEYAEKKAT